MRYTYPRRGPQSLFELLDDRTHNREHGRDLFFRRQCLNDTRYRLQNLAFLRVLGSNAEKMETYGTTAPLTGIPVNPACNSANAPMCGARAARLASQRSRSAFAAGRQSDGSGKAETTYEIAFMRREGDDVGVLVMDCVVNHDAYVPLRRKTRFISPIS